MGLVTWRLRLRLTNWQNSLRTPRLPSEGVTIQPMVIDLLRNVVMPVLSKMMDVYEVRGLAIYQLPEVDGAGNACFTIYLDLTVVGPESFTLPLGGTTDLPTSDVERRARLASFLQDAIAESKLGWGQLRSYQEG
jgi:hypothetical protein